MTAVDTSWADYLARFKGAEKPEVVLLVADEPDLVKVIIAWSHTVTRAAEPLSQLTSDSDDSAWKWLWENTRYSREDLLSKVPLQEREFERRWRILTGNRIIYPDGTVNAFVQRYLREKVLSLFGAKQGKSRG